MAKKQKEEIKQEPVETSEDKVAAAKKFANTNNLLENTMMQLYVGGLMTPEQAKKFAARQMTRDEAMQLWKEFNESRAKKK